MEHPSLVMNARVVVHASHAAAVALGPRSCLPGAPAAVHSSRLLLCTAHAPHPSPA